MRFACALLLAACTPVTTRPAFAPFPEALRAVIDAPPARVIQEAQAWLAAESIGVAWASDRDAFLETEWYDTQTKRVTGDVRPLAATVKIRLWADPDVPGKSRVTVEAAYKPFYDPSRTPRDLERAVPPTSEGHGIAERLLDALGKKFGVTVY